MLTQQETAALLGLISEEQMAKLNELNDDMESAQATLQIRDATMRLFLKDLEKEYRTKLPKRLVPKGQEKNADVVAFARQKLAKGRKAS